jgi:hypothetical protein
VCDEHVGRGLGHLVHEHAETGRDRRVEVRHLDLDPHPVRGLAADVEPEEAAAAAAGGDQQPIPDLPRDVTVVGLDHVFGRLEAQQRQRAADQHDRAGVLGVDDPNQAERHLGQEQPVGPAEVLEVGRCPEPIQRRLAGRQLGALNRPHGAVTGDHRRLLGRDDDRSPRQPRAAPSARGDQCNHAE